MATKSAIRLYLLISFTDFQCIYHKICNFKLYSSVVCSVFTLLFRDHRSLVLDGFSDLRCNSIAIGNHSFSPSPCHSDPALDKCYPVTLPYEFTYYGNFIVNQIIQFIVSPSLVILFILMFICFIHVSAHISASFLVQTKCIPLCDMLLLAYPFSALGYLDCFHFLKKLYLFI